MVPVDELAHGPGDEHAHSHLAAWLVGGLPPHEAALTMAHVGLCEECGRHAVEISAVLDELDGADPQSIQGSLHRSH